MRHPQLAPAEQDVGLHAPKAELQGVVERMGVRVVVMGVRRQNRADGASACLTAGRAWTDRGRDDQAREKAPMVCRDRASEGDDACNLSDRTNDTIAD
jgi:hypothetical protein